MSARAEFTRHIHSVLARTGKSPATLAIRPDAYLDLISDFAGVGATPAYCLYMGVDIFPGSESDWAPEAVPA